MELDLQSLFGHLWKAVLPHWLRDPATPPPPSSPAFGLINEGAVDPRQTTSLRNPLQIIKQNFKIKNNKKWRYTIQALKDQSNKFLITRRIFWNVPM